MANRPRAACTDAPDEVGEPVLPVAPEGPEADTGAEAAVELALPVSPELVADDWASEAPEAPELDSGEASTDEPPPSPAPAGRPCCPSMSTS